MKLYKADMTERVYVEATPGDVVAAFRALPLTTQMRAAADVLVEASKRRGFYPDDSWWPTLLRSQSDRFSREDAEKAKQDSEIDELARLLHDLAARGIAFEKSGTHVQAHYRERAKKLFAAGYRKQATDE